MQTRLTFWEEEMSKLSGKIENMFGEEVAKMETFLDNYRKVNGDHLGNVVSEMELQGQVD